MESWQQLKKGMAKVQNFVVDIFNSIHPFISDKSPYYTGYINYNHRFLIIN